MKLMFQRAHLLIIALIASFLVRMAHATIIPASENAWVLNGAGDQSEASTLSINGTTRITYLRFDITSLAINSNDLVYLDLYFSNPVNNNAVRFYVAALNDGVVGETTWDSTMSYATRPDGSGGTPNTNMTAVVTYDGRTMKQTAGSGGPRNQENPPGQIAIVIDPAVLIPMLGSDSNGELTLIVYGASSSSSIASLASTNLHPQLRILRAANVETIPESIYGGQLHGSSWDDSSATSQVGEEPYNQILLFPLSKRPTGGFKAEDTSLEVSLNTHDINPGNWGLAMVDVWALGYFPAGHVPLVKADVEDYLLEGDTASETGLNIGTNITQKIYNNLVCPYSSFVRYGMPPEACSSLAAFVNDLFENHGAQHGDYLVLRLSPDVAADNGQEYRFYTGNAAAAFKPSLTLSPIPGGTVIRLY